MNLKQIHILLALSFIPWSLLPMHKKTDAFRLAEKIENLAGKIENLTKKMPKLLGLPYLDVKIEDLINKRNELAQKQWERNYYVTYKNWGPYKETLRRIEERNALGSGEESYREHLEEYRERADKLTCSERFHEAKEIIQSHNGDDVIEDKLRILTQGNCKQSYEDYIRDVSIYETLFESLQWRMSFNIFLKVIKGTDKDKLSPFVEFECTRTILKDNFWQRNELSSTAGSIKSGIMFIEACGKCFKQSALSEAIAKQKEIHALHKKLIGSLEKFKDN